MKTKKVLITKEQWERLQRRQEAIQAIVANSAGRFTANDLKAFQEPQLSLLASKFAPTVPAPMPPVHCPKQTDDYYGNPGFDVFDADAAAGLALNRMDTTLVEAPMPRLR